MTLNLSTGIFFSPAAGLVSNSNWNLTKLCVNLLLAPFRPSSQNTENSFVEIWFPGEFFISSFWSKCGYGNWCANWPRAPFTSRYISLNANLGLQFHSCEFLITVSAFARPKPQKTSEKGVLSLARIYLMFRPGCDVHMCVSVAFISPALLIRRAAPLAAYCCI